MNTLHVLDSLRAFLKCPIYITSGYRSPELNQAVGGASQSYHKSAQAVDIKVIGMNIQTLYNHITKLIPLYSSLGITLRPLLETTWVHLTIICHHSFHEISEFPS